MTVTKRGNLYACHCHEPVPFTDNLTVLSTKPRQFPRPALAGLAAQSRRIWRGCFSIIESTIEDNAHRFYKISNKSGRDESYDSLNNYVDVEYPITLKSVDNLTLTKRAIPTAKRLLLSYKERFYLFLWLRQCLRRGVDNTVERALCYNHN